MGYVANGTEGEFYEAAICSRCIHYKDPNADDWDGETCAVWMIHLLHNYGQKDEAKEIMDLLIPRKGVDNDLCSMFHPAKEEWVNHGKDYQEWIETPRAERGGC